MCAPITLNFLFAKEDRFLMLFQTCTKLTFGLSDVLVRFFFRDRIHRFGKNLSQILNRFLSKFNVVAIQNCLAGFRNILDVGNNGETSRWFPLTSGVLLVVTGFGKLRRKVLVSPFAFRTSETGFLSSAFESSEDGTQSDLAISRQSFVSA